jgi:carboxymethylenebutenolidase
MRPAILILALLLAGCVTPEHVVEPAGPNESTNADMLQPGPFEVIAEDIEYFDGVKGFYARPAAAGEYPGVVMIHEWWGLNDNVRAMAKLLASQGYSVLAVDLFGTVATTPEQARAQVTSLDKALAIDNMKAASAFLRSRGAPKIASLGWCFGGGQSLQLALADGLDATVIYYGSLVTDESMLSVINKPVLGVFGGKDTSIPVASVNAFDSALDSLGVENEVYIYPDVGHAFANPSGANYAPEETKDAWAKTLAFLDKHLK